jgi:hypothetical protein
LGALGPGCEDITPREYVLICGGLLKSGHFERSHLTFFDEHIKHDGYHSQGIESSIDEWVAKHGPNAVEQGALKALALEEMYWNGVWEGIKSDPT